ncbi:hypothetical protein J6590_001339 [Homalodisca vitripennis]|nr:hypothetical protein J6590_001339 [Homalodisca vitripennis]
MPFDKHRCVIHDVQLYEYECLRYSTEMLSQHPSFVLVKKAMTHPLSTSGFAAGLDDSKGDGLDAHLQLGDGKLVDCLGLKCYPLQLRRIYGLCGLVYSTLDRTGGGEDPESCDLLQIVNYLPPQYTLNGGLDICRMG